ncbi:MAG: electron transport complex subunit RsxC [Alteromonadaceae bacterium]|jgi:electron transport complex protein RnfC|uniref:electron transport complex subunit RsxC n=1 Tax=Paraglaciecola chathamensis TaxID=368405 RepID=UPI000C661C41|nr:electron transport complex subunit RsxC [Paraglaciecola agarilytica]MBN27908.1 electron transport complex subunit RsxC [Alteromonadaceae bacterium]|tara:strand:- start:94307 stop:96889 length:2583 start_codon:yes stop_codon:yes gene_type:complete
MNRVLTPSYDEIVTRVERDKLWDFPGGVFPAQQKELSNQTPIENIDLPQRLFIPLKQHIGVEGQLLVSQGDYVLKGQPLTHSANPFSVPVHAPTSGTVTSIGPHISAHPSALPEQTLIIEPDHLDKWTTLQPLQDYQSKPKISVLEAICDAGISGMGGAGFPTHIKASPKKDVEFIIINGVECEPYITSDDRLMREHAWQIRQGIDVLSHLLAPKQVYIAIEDNKPEAIEAMRIACQQSEQYKVIPIATKYPAGGEKQLIQVITNREVPKQGLPIDVGVIMHNVGTCYAIADAVFSGKPLIQRVVTITGQAVEKPKNVWALIGTPVAHLLESAQYVAHKQKQKHIIMGGPMMGFTLASDEVPVVKITNCLLLPTSNEIAEPEAEQPCIRCSACADACPASLLPQQLFWHSKAKELDKAQDYNLFDCIECGACAYVCPSEIPLVHYYRVAKAEIRVEQEEKQKSDKARERFESRAARLVREQEARDEKHRKAAEARKAAMQNKGNDAQDKIAAALARAKAKKAQQSQAAQETTERPESQDKQTVTQQTSALSENATQSSGTSKDDRVAAAIARAKAKKAQQANRNEAAPVKDDSHEGETQTPISEQPVVKANEIAGQSKDERVAAAIARAKAKKALKAQTTQDGEKSSSEGSFSATSTKESEKPTESDQSTDVVSSVPRSTEPENTHPSVSNTETKTKDQRVAAAIAKAKAKKAQSSAHDSAQSSAQSASSEVSAAQNVETQASVHPVSAPKGQEVSQELDPAAQKKARIAAAVAKAKAKKLAKEGAAETGEEANKNATPKTPDGETSSAKQHSGVVQTATDQTTAPSDAEQALDEKKRRIAAAVAKAKAKKAAQMKSSEE